MTGGSFFAELRKRKVLQAAAIYGAVSWGVTEVVVTVTEQLFLPQWVSTLAVIGFVVGFPVAMFLSWTFDITSEGIQRTSISSRRGTASIVLSITLLITGTAGLFLLIKPSIDGTEPRPGILPNSIAVLPFEDASQDADDAYLSGGLSDELRDQLGRVAELRIAARSSSVAAVERGMDAIAASGSLQVAHLVEGSMRRRGKQLRVSVQLIEGRSGLAIWSETYERGANELLNVQQAIAEEIVRRVVPDAKNVVTAPATVDADANDLLLLAQHYEYEVRSRPEIDEDKLVKAVGLYRAATEADPTSALAFSRLARALLFLGDIKSAEGAITQAMLIDPNLSEVQNTLGETYWALDMPAAAAAFKRAVELDPYNADALANYANQLWMTIGGKAPGNPRAGDLYQRALDNDRLSLARYAALGSYHGRQGHAAEVRPIIEDIKVLFDSVEAYRAIDYLYELIGEVDQAIAWAIRARDLEPDNPDHILRLAGLFALLGDADTALQLEPEPSIWVLYHLRRYDELIEIAEFVMIEDPGDIDTRYLLSFAHAATGNNDQAIRILGSTGLPDSVLEDRPRSTSEVEAFETLINALLGSDIPDANEAGLSLAQLQEDVPWWGDIGWIGLYRACNYANIGKREAALEFLAKIKQSVRLRREPELRDLYCFRDYQDEPVYQSVVKDQEARRARLREKLPATLAEFGVELWPQSNK